MGALAGLLVELGHEVSGSDVAFDPPIGPALQQWGVRCLQGYDPSHLEPAPELVVIGNVCRSDNPEARAAIDGGLPYTHIAGALQRFALAQCRPLVVTGTHGKTTTTSMAAWLLDAAGQRPGFLVGGIPANFQHGFRAAKLGLPLVTRLDADAPPSKLPPFVLEGDEYDTAFFEKSPKFVHYRAQVVILTSIEHDHIDIYPEPEQYFEAFRRLLRELPESGLVVANAGDPQVVRLVQEAARCEVSWYGLEGATAGLAAHWLAAPVLEDPAGQSFDLFAGGTSVGRFRLPMTGRHNLQNAVAAIGAVAQGFGLDPRTVAQALSGFLGVKRRQELRGTPGGVAVYDDFAHHPTAVRETLLALKARHPGGRLFAVFEPRSATACRKLHQSAYPEAFDPADFVLLAPVGRANLPEGERLDVEQLARDVVARGRQATAPGTVEAIVEQLAQRVRPGDVVALLSNGAFGGIHARVLQRLAQPAPTDRGALS